MTQRFLSEKSVFDEALQRASTAEERERYLTDACGEDSALLCRVRHLLAVHEQQQGPLDFPPPGFIATQPHESLEAPGTQIGLFTLREPIGEGGFGIVYIAEQQQPVARRVALKVIKPGMDSRDVIARFEAERQALAMMDHPNVARVLDAGTTRSGRPYFVMELVCGVPITEFCDARRLSVADRLRLFTEVCRAVQHAHQKGIIHRDVKPSNILVSVWSEKPIPKVIDFGISKALGAKLSENTIRTTCGQMLGTPLYMSPEQAQPGGLDVDTRSDVYSLGVLLYELLTGTTPFERRQLECLGIDEFRRLICEQDPPRPSARVSTLNAARLSTVGERLSGCRIRSRSLCGELDWIVMRSMEKDRSRRYESASALAADVERILSGEPVEACPPSVSYRLRVYVRRNRSLLLTLSAIALVLLVGTGVSIWQALEAHDARKLADERYQAEHRARRETNQSRQLAELRSRQARRAVDKMYTEVAEKWFEAQGNMTPLQRDFLVEALRFYEDFSVTESADPEIRFETALASYRVAEIQRHLGEHTKAIAAYRTAISTFNALVTQFPENTDYRRALAKSCCELAVGLLLGSRRADREDLHKQGIAHFEHLVQQDSHCLDSQRGLSHALRLYGDHLNHVGAVVKAEEVNRRGLALARRIVSLHPEDETFQRNLRWALYSRVTILRRLDRNDESTRLARELVHIDEARLAGAPRNWVRRYEHADSLWQLSSLLADEGDIGEAERLLCQAEDLQAQLVVEFPDTELNHFRLHRTRRSLGRLLQQSGRYADAQEVYLRNLQSAQQHAARPSTEEDRLSARTGDIIRAFWLLAELAASAGKSAESESWLKQALELHTASVSVQDEVTRFLQQRGREADAIDWHRSALQEMGEEPHSLNSLAWLLCTAQDPTLRRPGEAVELATRATELSPLGERFWNTLGVAHFRNGNWTAAIRALKKSIAQQPLHKNCIFNSLFLAMSYWRLGDRDEANRWYERAMECLRSTPLPDHGVWRILAEAEDVMGIRKRTITENR